MEDLRAVKDRVEFLLRGIPEARRPGATSGTDYHDDRFLYEKLVEAIGNHLGMTAEGLPYGVYLKTTKGRQWAPAAKAFYKFVDEYFKPAERKDRVWAIEVLCSAVVSYLDAHGIPLSPVAGCLWVHRIADVVDSQFPDYRQSGLLASALAV